MKEKLLKEKGAVKAWIIILVIVLCLAVAGGIFAYLKINEDKEDDEDSKSTSQKKEDKQSKKDKDDDDDDEKDDMDDDDEKDEKEDKKESKKSSKKSTSERHFTGTVNMDEIINMKGTEWTIDVYGNDERLNKIVFTVDMEDLLDTLYKQQKDSYDDYDDFIEEVQDSFDEPISKLGESFAESSGLDESDIKTKAKWITDEIIEMTVDCSMADFSEANIDGDNVIETVIEKLEEHGAKMKEVK